ncbi:MAG: hypothetical protein FWB85_01180 [Chitinispirillia bacterium]|nr:hypothetical protein [Chitinispirillia bacterium]MCL2241272.1 hypothetical protein [Chitinispirillia bacterium]
MKVSGLTMKKIVARAKMVGYVFIEIMLLNDAFNRVQGAHVLRASRTIDSITNTEKFDFYVDGGPLNFTWDDDRGGSYCQVLDCAHNRRLLRGHYNNKGFEFADKAQGAQVMAGEPAPGMPNGPASPPPANENTVNPTAEILAELQAERAKSAAQAAELAELRKAMGDKAAKLQEMANRNSTPPPVQPPAPVSAPPQYPVKTPPPGPGSKPPRKGPSNPMVVSEAK